MSIDGTVTMLLRVVAPETPCDDRWILRRPPNPNLFLASWYISNVSIIFDCSMLYSLLFWTILGFIFHFYIIFGTNLLTGGPAQNCYFLPISVFRINRISNGVQTEYNLRQRDFLTERDLGEVIFGTKATRWTWTPRQGRKEELTRVGARPPPRARPPASWLPCWSPDVHSKSPVLFSFQK